MHYALGKTPLQERIQRYLDWFGKPAKFIPIHPKEYTTLLDKSYREFQRLEKHFGQPIRPLGWDGGNTDAS
jgi:hypothetical protein